MKVQNKDFVVKMTLLNTYRAPNLVSYFIQRGKVSV